MPFLTLTNVFWALGAVILAALTVIVAVITINICRLLFATATDVIAKSKNKDKEV